MRSIMTLIMLLGMAQTAFAADYFVQETEARGLNQDQVESIKPMIEDSITSNTGNQVVESAEEADFVMASTLLKLGSTYILKVERMAGEEVVSSAQTKARSLDELSNNIGQITLAAVNGNQRPRGTSSKFSFRANVGEGQQGSNQASAGTTQAETGELQPKMDTRSHWRLGFGPFFGRQLDTDNVMYHLSGGYIWEVHPQAEVKIIGEGAFASSDDSARFLNVGAGASYFFPSGTNTSAPFITGDMGVGAAETDDGSDASGFSFGLGVGYQFFRNTERSLDVLFRYALITDTIEATDGSPSILGAHLAFNF